MNRLPSPSDASPTPGSRRLWMGGLLALLAIGLVLVLEPQKHLAAAREWLAGLGPWAPVIFIALYILACVCLVPGSALTLAAGALFGLVRGSLLVSVGATLGATAAFLVGRHLARDAVEKRLERFPQFKAVSDAVALDGWKVVLLTRLSPAFPFTLLNYAYGLTRVTLKDYVSATWLGMLPGTLLYVYLGSVSGAVAEAASGAASKSTPLRWAFLAVGLIATVAVTVVVTRLARRALQQRVGPN